MNPRIGILIVEDRSLVASKVKRELIAAGLQVAGLAATVPLALRLAEAPEVTGAVLDVDLRGEAVYPVASVLRQRRLPFVFLTGYGQIMLPPEWQDVHLVEKPFDGPTLLRALRAAFSGHLAPPAEPRVRTPVIQRAWDQVRFSRDLVMEQRAWSEERDPSPEPVEPPAAAGPRSGR